MISRVIRSSRSVVRPSVRGTLCLGRFNSSTPRTDTSKAFKAASFSLPKEPEAKNIEVPKQDPVVPQEDIDDFKATKLIHGNTKLQIAITSRARDKLNSIAESDNNPNTALKISVESGGCHGFQYNLDLTDLNKELDQSDEDDDILVFRRDDGTNQVAQVVLDESSLEILQDSKIDYTKELIGSSFKVVDSPYTSTACGCGASFDFDFDKLQKKNEERERNQ